VADVAAAAAVVAAVGAVFAAVLALLAAAAAALFDWPARQLIVIGVTGTDGKTSLSHLIAHVLESAGERVGLMSTAENRAAGRALADSDRFTTPEAPQVQGVLAQTVEAGCRYAVLEATSHGLVLHRLDCCEFDVAAMTAIEAARKPSARRRSA